MSSGRVALTISAVFALALPCAAQAPIGPSFEVDARTAGDQLAPAVAVDRSSGQFVVVWASRPRLVAIGDIVGRRFAADGSPEAGVFRVSAQPHNFRSIPLAADGAGGWIAAWENASGYDISTRRRLFEGAPAGPARTANATTAGIQSSPSVAADASGNFVVVWQDSGKTGDSYGVFGQRFDAAGDPVGDEFQVSGAAAGHQGAASVAMDGSGNFVVAWVGSGIHAQRFDASGARVGAEIQVNAKANGAAFAPKVALDGAGHALVVWQRRSGPRLVSRRFDTSGAPLGPETVLDARHGTDAAVAGSSAGFVVVWLSATGAEAFGQRIGSDGGLIGPAFAIDAATARFVRGPAVGMDDSGAFVVAWSGGGAQRGIFARQFTSWTATALESDAVATTTRASAESSALPLTLASRTFAPASLAGWTLPAGWTPKADGEGVAVQIAAAEAGSSSAGGPERVFGDAAVTADFTFTGVTGTAQLIARDGEAGSYVAGLDAAGLVTLEKRDGEGTVLASWSAPAPAQAIPGAARTLRLSAVGPALTVAVDDTDVLALDDEAPLPPGAHKVGALFAEPAGALTFDKYAVWIPVDGIDGDTSPDDPVDAAAAPGKPVLSTSAAGAPSTPLANGARTNLLQPILAWTPGGAGPVVDYEVQVSTTLNFLAPVVDTVVSEPTRFLETPSLGGPPAGQKFYWRVRARNAEDQFGPFSAVYNFTLDRQAPPLPALLSPALGDVSATLRPTFKWAAAGDATRYRLLVTSNFSCSTLAAPGSDVSDITTTSFTLPFDLPQGEYWYCVEATDAAGNVSGFGEKRKFVINVSLQPANGANVITNADPYRPNVVLTWTNVPGATYDIEVASDSSFTDLPISQPVTGTRFTVNTLSFGTYYWRVKVNGQALPQVLSRHFTITPPVPVAPGIQTAVPGSLKQGAITNDTTPVFDWSVPANWVPLLPGQSLTYEFQLATDAAFTAPVAGGPVMGLVSSNYEWTASTLPDTPGTTYYWRVRALTNLGVNGAWSITWRFTLDTAAPGPPASLTAPANEAITTSARPVFSWAKGTDGATRYRFEIDDDRDFTSPRYTTIVGTTSHTPTETQPQGILFWRVSALDAAGNESAPAPSRTMTIDYRTAPTVGKVFTTTTSPTGFEVKFTWIKPAGAPAGTTFIIEIDKDLDGSVNLTLGPGETGSNKSFVLVGNYQYRLVVDNGLGTSDWRPFQIITAP